MRRVPQLADMQGKTSEELLLELGCLRRRVAELEQRAEQQSRRYQERIDALVEKRAAELKLSNLELRREIIEHTDSEKALRHAEEKLRLMFESFSDGIVVTDLAGQITDLNQRLVKMYGFIAKEDLIGKSFIEMLAESEQGKVRDGWQAARQRGTKNTEYLFVKGDGSTFPVEISTSVLKDASGNHVGFLAIVKDITDRKKIEEQLIITDRLASVGELASGIAHELNNPLTSVIGFSQLLLSRDLPEDIRADIDTVHREAQRTAEVVKNLLTFARRHIPAKQMVNLNTVIEKVLELRAYENKISNIEIVRDFADGLPEVMADFFQMQQVFLNIVINAEFFMLEAHGKGTLTITTSRRGEFVRVSFADDGPGIARENIGHLFDPFFTTKEVGKGTGLGLSICHGIITEHGGRIFVESAPGAGANFIIELPVPAAGKQA